MGFFESFGSWLCIDRNSSLFAKGSNVPLGENKDGGNGLNSQRNRGAGFLTWLRTMIFGTRDPESDLCLETLEELHMLTGCKCAMLSVPRFQLSYDFALFLFVHYPPSATSVPKNGSSVLSSSCRRLPFPAAPLSPPLSVSLSPPLISRSIHSSPPRPCVHVLSPVHVKWLANVCM